MKSIYHKFKINFLCYFIFLSFLLTGYIKNILFIFLIIVVHELGHILFLKRYGYTILKVELFPFGGMTTSEKYLNSPINQDIWIYSGGILFQLILGLFFAFLFHKGFIYSSTYQLFTYYNLGILLFNLLPIKPLDGGEIFFLLFQKVCSFSKSITISLCTSLFFLILFLFYMIQSNLNQYIVLSFLIYKLLSFYKKRNYYQNKFYLERFLYLFPYKKIEHHNMIDLKVLKKETLHFFKKENKYVHEKEILKQRFDK